MDVLINELIHQWAPAQPHNNFCMERAGNDSSKCVRSLEIRETELPASECIARGKPTSFNALEEKIPVSLRAGDGVTTQLPSEQTDERHIHNRSVSNENDKIAAEKVVSGVDDKIVVNEDGIEQPGQGVITTRMTEIPDINLNASHMEDQPSAPGSVTRLDLRTSTLWEPDLASPKFPVIEDRDRLDQELIMPDGLDKEVVRQSSQTESILSSQASFGSLSTSYHDFNFYYTNSYTNVIVTDANKQAMFFSEVSTFSKGVPDVQLRNIAQGPGWLAKRGEDLKAKDAALAKVVAVADFLPSSNHIRLGFGYLEIPESVSWAVMKCIDATVGAEKWEMTLSVDQSPDRKYQWVRGGRNVAQTGESVSAPSDSKIVYTMRSETGILATLRATSLTNLKKRGILRVYDVPEAEDLHLAIILSFTALSEKSRRQSWKRSLSLRRAPSKKS